MIMMLTRGLLNQFIRFYKYSNWYHAKLYKPLQWTTKMSTNRKTVRELMMVKPACFCENIETASSNVYQGGSLMNASDQEMQVKVIKEFDELVIRLQHNIGIRVFEDTPSPVKPDAVFPNNWISFHDSKKIALYPMFSAARRAERRDDIVRSYAEEFGYEVIDYSHFEKESKYLEGTGSMVLDRPNKIAYACKSARTHSQVLDAFCEDFGYRPIIFEANYKNKPIYHTNVMMSVAEEFALICTDCIVDPRHVVDSLQSTSKHIVNLSVEQIANFCGNALPFYDGKGTCHLAMSTRAFEALSASQVMDIEQYCKIVHSPIPVIETVGGGSVRCMLTEVF